MIINNSHSKFIVIEGVDGVGKTTIAQKISEYMPAQYYKTPPMFFEQFAMENAQSRQSLRQFIDEMAYSMPQARYLAYLFGLLKSSQEIEYLLQNGSVICDRYLSSTLAYHWTLDNTLQGANLDWLSILKPDFEVLLTIYDNKEYRRRLGERVNLTRKLRLEEDTAYMMQVQETFLKMNLVEVNVDGRLVDEIARLILEKIAAI